MFKKVGFTVNLMTKLWNANKLYRWVEELKRWEDFLEVIKWEFEIALKKLSKKTKSLDLRFSDP